MKRFIPLGVAAFAVSLGVGFSPAPPGKFTPVDLEPYVNQKLKDNFGSGRDGNTLESLRKGERTLGEVNFKIASGVVELHSNLLAVKRPEKVEGIKVGKKCEKLHILHATQYGNGQGIGEEGKAGDPLYVADGTKIAEYKINYDDGKSVTIAVVYGQDVRDWWFTEKSKGVTRGKIVWTGDNELAKELNSRLRLYMTSWTNPHPDKTIATIDYVKVGDNPAAPFCAALTLEAK
jgi:hypothetical protein